MFNQGDLIIFLLLGNARYADHEAISEKSKFQITVKPLHHNIAKERNSLSLRTKILNLG